MTNTNDDTEKFKLFSRLMDEGKYPEALMVADTVSEPLHRASILVDAGFALGKSGKVRQGTAIFEDLSNSEYGKKYARHSLLYNIANGHYAIYSLRKIRRKKTIPPNDDDLRTAKKLYRETLKELPSEKGSFSSQVWVNYGNCLSHLGRSIEAIECYQRGLKADATNGMAAGNLGIGLEHVAQIMGHYIHEYRALAHDTLTRALGPAMHLKFGSMQAVQSFQTYHKRLEDFLKAHKEPINVPEPVKTRGRTKREKEYVQFCIDKGLFLNAWVGDSSLSPGIVDEISYGPIITPIDDDYVVPELLRILNEIKEAYATARYLYFLSQRENSLLDKISSMTIYFDNLDYDVNGIYTGLCKTAYSRAFDILDKVGRIINVYFEIGERKVEFWDLLAEKQSLGEKHTLRFGVRPAVAKTGNYGLFALADVCIDYFEREHVDLKTIDIRRNKITHDYLTMRLFTADTESDSVVNLDSFAEQTENVLRLAKYAILYVVSAVNISEAQKKSTGPSGDVFYLSNPGQPFL
jgi:tetratricopeptide (TPR) repeat protein